MLTRLPENGVIVLLDFKTTKLSLIIVFWQVWFVTFSALTRLEFLLNAM
jgi:hypothetical protein